MINKVKSLWNRSDFFKNIMYVLSGTMVAQALPIVLSPVLTRIYSPETYGILGLYISVATTLSIISTFGYHKSLLIPKRFSGLNLFMLTLILSAVVSILIAGGLNLLSFFDVVPEKFKSLTPWFKVIGISVFLYAAYQTCYCWVNREKKFKTLSATKMTQSVFLVGTQLLLGLINYTSIGLIVGLIIGQIAACAVLVKSIVSSNKKAFRHFSFKRAKLVAKRYIKFPIYTLPAEVTNTISGQLPIILFTGFFNLKVSGYFFLTSRILSVPISLLAVAVTDVFREKAAEDLRETGNCQAIFIKTFKLLFLLGIGPSILLFFIAPYLFPFVFGAEWTESGIYAQYLVPLFFTRFVISPLSYVFYITEKMNIDLVWQIFLVLSIAGGIGIGIWLNDPHISIMMYSLIHTLMYIIYGVISYKISNQSDSFQATKTKAI